MAAESKPIKINIVITPTISVAPFPTTTLYWRPATKREMIEAWWKHLWALSMKKLHNDKIGALGESEQDFYDRQY